MWQLVENRRSWLDLVLAASVPFVVFTAFSSGLLTHSPRSIESLLMDACVVYAAAFLGLFADAVLQRQPLTLRLLVAVAVAYVWGRWWWIGLWAVVLGLTGLVVPMLVAAGVGTIVAVLGATYRGDGVATHQVVVAFTAAIAGVLGTWTTPLH